MTISGVVEDVKLPPNSQLINTTIHSNSESQSSSPIRKTPQFVSIQENKNTIHLNNVFNESKNENIFPQHLPQNIDQNIDEKKREESHKATQVLTDSVTSASRYTPLPLGSTPKPFQRISGMHSKPKPNENRIHFPIDISKEVDSIISQPIISEPISPYSQSNGRPSKPFNSGSTHNQHNSNANKFRLKPVPTMTQSGPSHSPLGSSQMPNLRLPPFLLHTHNNPNTHSVNNVRHRSTTHSPIPPSEDILIKSETIDRNITSMTDNIENGFTSNSSNNLPNNLKSESNSLTPEYHSTSSQVNYHSMIP